MPTVERPDAEIYYEVHGANGPTVAFAHGLGGNAASWWQQVPHFRDRYRVVIFDHRGFGRSRCFPEDFHVKHFSVDVVQRLWGGRCDAAKMHGSPCGDTSWP